MTAPWWQERKTELVSIVRETGPVVLYCEEALNEIVFDLLSLDSVDGLYWDLHVNTHPRVLEALGRLGSGFLYRREEELLALTQSRRPIYADRFLRIWKEWVPDRVPLEIGTRTAVALPPAELVRALRRGGDACDLLVRLPVPAAGRDAPVPAKALEGPGASAGLLQGAYLPWGRDVPMAQALESVRSWMDVLNPSGTLVLGRGLGIVMDEETGRPDLKRTGMDLDPLREAFPGMEIRVEAGEDLLCTAGALLIPVRRVFEEGGRVFAEVGVDPGELMGQAWTRVKARVRNLTGEATGRTKTTVGLLGREAGRGSSDCTYAVMPGPEEGDVLLVPRMGVAIPGTGEETPSGGIVRARYLNARRICQVPL